MISPLFTTIVITFLIAFIYLKSTANKVSIHEDKVFEKEREANNTRKQSLDNLPYITVPIEELPLDATDDDALNELQDTIRSLSDKKIVNFTGISNTDLKLNYGAANLPELTEYDQNYTTLVTALNDYGNLLINKEETKKAKTVLEYAVSCHTDIKASYVALASIYAENFEFDQIDHLIEIAEGLNSLMKEPIIRALKEKSDLSNYISEIH